MQCVEIYIIYQSPFCIVSHKDIMKLCFWTMNEQEQKIMYGDSRSNPLIGAAVIGSRIVVMITLFSYV
jgi:hypothetical protein